MDVEPLEARERALLEAGVELRYRDVAVAHEHRVAGVVMAAVEIDQTLVAQVRDVLRVTAAVVVVGGAGEEVLGQRLPEQARDAAHRAFHLVVDHAFEFERARGVFGICELEAMAFLREVHRVEPREEHRVEVHIEQVEEILAVLAREGIGRPVAAGEGVHEGVQRTARHHEKGVAHGVAFAAAERGVLEDVCHARGILRHGAQRDEEDVLGVVRGDVQVLRPGDAVTVLLDHHVQCRHRRAAQPFEGGVYVGGAGRRGGAGNAVHARCTAPCSRGRARTWPVKWDSIRGRCGPVWLLTSLRRVRTHRHGR